MIKNPSTIFLTYSGATSSSQVPSSSNVDILPLNPFAKRFETNVQDGIPPPITINS